MLRIPSQVRRLHISAPPSPDALYSTELAGFIKCLDKVATVVVNSPMLARCLHLSPRRNSFPCILLPPLCARFSRSSLYFQSLTASFRKTPGVGVPQRIGATLSMRRHMRHVAPLSPVASIDCAYFLSPRGCTTRPPVEEQNETKTSAGEEADEPSDLEGTGKPLAEYVNRSPTPWRASSPPAAIVAIPHDPVGAKPLRAATRQSHL